MTEIAAPALREPAKQADLKRLMLFFALVYLTEGIGQSDGLISQPLNYYLKQVYQWTPVQVTAFLTVLNLPWFLKPLYGMASDFVPLFGYRRKSYLLFANAMAAAGFFAIAGAATPSSRRCTSFTTWTPRRRARRIVEIPPASSPTAG